MLGLNASLWLQVVGMAISMALGVTIFSTYHSQGSTLELTLLLLTELFIVLFSISTFSIYLSKSAVKRSEKLGLRKTLGTSSWNLFLETSAQTTFLLMVSIVLSIGLIDVGMLLAGLSFELVLQSIGILHYGVLLLSVFILSEGMLFIIQGVALAPNARNEFEETTLYEKNWFLNLIKVLCRLSILFGLFALVSFVLLWFSGAIGMRATVLEIIFYIILITWWALNRKQGKIN